MCCLDGIDGCAPIRIIKYSYKAVDYIDVQDHFYGDEWETKFHISKPSPNYSMNDSNVKWTMFNYLLNCGKRKSVSYKIDAIYCHVT